jgi:hypothetical protein
LGGQVQVKAYPQPPSEGLGGTAYLREQLGQRRIVQLDPESTHLRLQAGLRLGHFRQAVGPAGPEVGGKGFQALAVLALELAGTDVEAVHDILSREAVHVAMEDDQVGASVALEGGTSPRGFESLDSVHEEVAQGSGRVAEVIGAGEELGDEVVANQVGGVIEVSQGIANLTHELSSGLRCG